MVQSFLVEAEVGIAYDLKTICRTRYPAFYRAEYVSLSCSSITTQKIFVNVISQFSSGCTSQQILYFYIHQKKRDRMKTPYLLYRLSL